MIHATRRWSSDQNLDQLVPLQVLPSLSLCRFLFRRGPIVTRQRQRLRERMGRLDNVVGADLGKVMAAVHERIPMVTPEEQRELKLKTAEEEARLVQSLHDMHAEAVMTRRGTVHTIRCELHHGTACSRSLPVGATTLNKENPT